MKSCIPLRILWNCYLLKSKTILQMKNIALPWYIFSLKKLENINSELTFAEWKFKLVWMSFFVEKYVECQACLLTYFSMNDACSSFESNNFANQHNAMLALLLPYNCPAGWVVCIFFVCIRVVYHHHHLYSRYIQTAALHKTSKIPSDVVDNPCQVLSIFFENG